MPQQQSQIPRFDTWSDSDEGSAQAIKVAEADVAKKKAVFDQLGAQKQQATAPPRFDDFLKTDQIPPFHQFDRGAWGTKLQKEVGDTGGIVAPGNLDPYHRPIYKHPHDEGYGTTYSMSFEDKDGTNVLIPQIVNGQMLTKQQAIDHYRQTGEHFGKFATWQDADKYALALHNSQDAYLRQTRPDLYGGSKANLRGDYMQRAQQARSGTNPQLDKLAHDIEWHFGNSVLQAFPTLPQDKQQQIMELVTRFAGEDVAKKKKGALITKSPAWQLRNQQLVGAVEGKDIEARTTPEVTAQQQATFRAGANPLLKLPNSMRILAESMVSGGAGLLEFGAGALGPNLGGGRLGQVAKQSREMAAESQAVSGRGKLTKLAQGVGSGVIEFAPLMALPELGLETVMGRIGASAALGGAYSGTQAVGRGEDAASIAREAGVGAATFGLMGVPLPGKSLLAKALSNVVITGGGATLINKATGTTWEDAATQGLVLTLMRSPELIGKLKVRDEKGVERPATPADIKALGVDRQLGPARFEMETGRPSPEGVPQTTLEANQQIGRRTQYQSGHQGELWTGIAQPVDSVVGRADIPGEFPPVMNFEEFAMSRGIDLSNPQNLPMKKIDIRLEPLYNAYRESVKHGGGRGEGTVEVPFTSGAVLDYGNFLQGFMGWVQGNGIDPMRMAEHPDILKKAADIYVKTIAPNAEGVRTLAATYSFKPTQMVFPLAGEPSESVPTFGTETAKPTADALEKARLSQQYPGVIRMSEETARANLQTLKELKASDTWKGLSKEQKASVEAQMARLEEQGAGSLPAKPEAAAPERGGRWSTREQLEATPEQLRLMQREQGIPRTVKVVLDEEGVPVTYYHGTSKSFDQLRPGSTRADRVAGIYMTEHPDKASDYAMMNRGLGNQPNVRPAYLVMNKTFDLAGKFNSKQLLELAGAARKLGRERAAYQLEALAKQTDNDYYTKAGKDVFSILRQGTPEEATGVLKEAGYDSFRNTAKREVVVFDAHQVVPKYTTSPKTLGYAGATRNLSEGKVSRETPAVEQPPKPTVPAPGQEGSATLDAISGGLVNKLNTIRQTIVTYARTRSVRDTMAHTRDAGDNGAMILGRRMRGDVSGQMREALGRLPREAQDALSFVIESKGDPTALVRDQAKIASSTKASPGWKKRSLAAIDYAQTHYNELLPAAQRSGEITDAQVVNENAAGVDTLRREGYVMHAQDIEGPETGLFAPGGGSGEAAGFKKVRQYETFADSIAAGVNPKTLNALDLLESRVSRGQRLINRRAWVSDLRGVNDAHTNTPIVRDPDIVKRANGETYPQPPRGYSLEYNGFQPIAVHNGYEGIYSALTDPSWFSKNAATRGFLQANTAGKSISLMLDTFHLGRLAMWQSLIKGLGVTTFKAPFPTYRRGLTLLDSTPAEINRMAANGEIPKGWTKDLLESKRIIDLGVEHGYNVGGISDALYQDLIHALPVVGSFNKWLFSQFQRGAMTETFLLEFERRRLGRPNEAESVSARFVAQDLNTRFGNLGRQGIFKSRTGQDLVRSLTLAPQWNEGLIRSELGAVKQAGQLVVDVARGRGIYSGVLLRSVGGMAVAQFAANQIINYITRGHPTWENEEEGWGSKISAYIPDKLGGGPGFFLHPMGLAAETTHLLLKGYERTEDFGASLRNYLRSRASTAMRPVLTFITNRDYLDRSLKPGTLWSEMAKTIPMPIPGRAIYQAGKQVVTGQHHEEFPGQFQKQVMSSFGVRTEPVPSAEQRIRNLASAFNKAHGIEKSGEFYESPYQGLSNNPTLNEVKQLIEEKTRNEFTTRQEAIKQIREYYIQRVDRPLTGSKERERAFKETLTPEQTTQLEKLKERRREERNRIQNLLNQL